MGFASAWLKDNALFPDIIKEEPDNHTGIIVVIPAFDEPSITNLLDSLNACEEPCCRVEVLIVINAPAGASEESIENNRICRQNIDRWISDKRPFFRIAHFDTGTAPFPGWGVGMARKCGMDEALRRFDSLNETEGAIVSLDADCTVERNYFTALCNDFFMKKERKACSLYFEHPLRGSHYSENIYNNIILYELHLRYFFQGLRYTGFPYSFHTVGSAIAVKALQYVLAGGMNRRQAGEDFYFVQKLAPMGGYFSLSSTTVYPSPRESFRVPFGTGMTISKLTGDPGANFLTYNTKAFGDLKILFNLAEKISGAHVVVSKDYYGKLPEGLRLFVTEDEWTAKLTEIHRNTSSPKAFVKRFFSWFNMFRIVKYLNFAHNDFYKKIPVRDAAVEMLVLSDNKTIPEVLEDLLLYYRNLERR